MLFIFKKKFAFISISKCNYFYLIFNMIFEKIIYFLIYNIILYYLTCCACVH